MVLGTKKKIVKFLKTNYNAIKCSADLVHAFQFGVEFVDIHVFSLFSKEWILILNFLNYSDLHVTQRVSG